jgi:SAM-dependent methyltransferase
MPDLQWNRSTWDGDYGWAGGGEEWSKDWGGSEAQWFGTLYPRLHRALPARAILEIAPGFGRWTRFLLPLCENYIGIDLSASCVQACRETFAAAEHATFLQNDGISLSEIANESFDLVFSFDSLVHAELDVLEQYIPQIIAKLTQSGIAFLHHSNFLSVGENQENLHCRGVSVSAAKVHDIVASSGGEALIQEMVNWGGTMLHDCFTLFRRATTDATIPPVRLQNPYLMDEARLIKNAQSFYSRLGLSEA